MNGPRNGAGATYVTKRAGKGSQAVKTIVTPAGSFRTISKDVFDRAMRSANTTLRRSGTPPALGPDDARER